MATSVFDCALVLQSMVDARGYDYTTPLMKSLEAPILGRPRGFFERYASEPIQVMMDRYCQRLEEAGAIIHDIALPPSFEEVVRRHRTVMAVEAAMFHEERFRLQPEDYPPNVSTLLEEGIACSASEYARCKAHQKQLTEEMAEVLSELDALICPATTTPAPIKETTGDPAFNSPWSYTGLPVVSFPVEVVEGLPIGVQLIGEARQETVLFMAAAWCEQQRERVEFVPRL
jgi:aspartyl-tRNA(Asn)/glutamyl-tRNA(Gln) amidotransferase subunit A